METIDSSRRRRRRQPDPVRPFQHRLRGRLQPGDADRGHRRPRDPLRARRASGSGEVVAGAVLKHARDFNLTREAVLGSKLSAETPATDIQQACGTGLQAAIQVVNKIALGQIDAGIAGGTDTTSDAPVAISDKLRKKLMKVNAARDTAGRIKALGAIRPGDIGLRDPAERRAPHPAVDGRARRADRAGVADRSRGAGRARGDVAPAARGGVRRGLPRRPGHAVPRAGARQQPAAGLLGREARRSSSRSSARARRRR